MFVAPLTLALAAAAPGAASIELRLAGHVPVTCALEIAAASDGARIGHRCNSDHEVWIRFDPASVPEGMRVIYGGAAVELGPAGEAVLWSGARFTGVKAMSLTGGAPAERAAFLASARFSVRTL